jgi:hypothetical protein
MTDQPLRYGPVPAEPGRSGLVFDTNAKRLALGGLGSLGFVAVGFVLVAGGKPLGWLGVVAFGVFALVAFGRVLRPGGLGVTSAGVSYRVGRTGFVSTWEALGMPEWRYLSGASVLCLRAADPAGFRTFGQIGPIAKINRNLLGGVDFAIPAQNLRGPEALIRLTLDHFAVEPAERARLDSSDVVEYVQKLAETGPR